MCWRVGGIGWYRPGRKKHANANNQVNSTDTQEDAMINQLSLLLGAQDVANHIASTENTETGCNLWCNRKTLLLCLCQGIHSDC
jgi:hypothetical protein